MGGEYRPIAEEEEPENLKESKVEPEQVEIEEDSVILWGDNLLIVDRRKFNTDGQEAHYTQINHILGQLSSNKKIKEETIKKADCEFMLDLKSPNSSLQSTETYESKSQHDTER